MFIKIDPEKGLVIDWEAYRKQRPKIIKSGWYTVEEIAVLIKKNVRKTKRWLKNLSRTPQEKYYVDICENDIIEVATSNWHETK